MGGFAARRPATVATPAWRAAAAVRLWQRRADQSLRAGADQDRDLRKHHRHV